MTGRSADQPPSVVPARRAVSSIAATISRRAAGPYTASAHSRALLEGLLRRRRLAPDDVPDDLFARVLQVLGGTPARP